jgi:hypothetical protein
LGFQGKTWVGLGNWPVTTLGVNCKRYCESRQAGRDLHLHVDGAGFDPFKSYGGNTLDHAALSRGKP